MEISINRSARRIRPKEKSDLTVARFGYVSHSLSLDGRVVGCHRHKVYDVTAASRITVEVGRREKSHVTHTHT